MKLSQILKGIEVLDLSGPPDCEIASLAYDSRKAAPGSLFFALHGAGADGHHFIGDAVRAGALAVFSAEPCPSSRATVVRVENTRGAMALAAANFHRHPSRKLKLAGITGTNGKTTVAFLVKHLCQASAQWRCGLVGTVRYEVGERILPAPHTTPEAPDLQELLASMVAAGCKAAAMEVSSHALAQDRVLGTEFDVAVFTNLTQDHLDYHRSMDDYFAAKSRLFAGLAGQETKKARVVVNLDDTYGARLLTRLPKYAEPLTFGMGSRADFRAGSFTMDFQGMSYQLMAGGRSFLVRLPLIGRFNIYNSLAALAAGSALGLDLRHMVKALADAPQVPGRLEAVPAKRNFRVFVDYAHTPDALASVLATLRELSPRRILVMFGCGGDRDKAKRPLMARAVEAGADYAIVTSDNPRSEDPDAILDDIEKGFRNLPRTVIPDRKEAIFKAIALAGPRDIVLLAGKGHETYQEIASQRLPFSDTEVASWALEGRPADFVTP